MTSVEWAPKNGERVWIKVFSNWSLGTYIGFDTTENTHLVREDVSGGGSLMSSSQVLPESAYPNLPKQPTAVEFLVDKLFLHEYEDVIQEAKEMENDQRGYTEGDMQAYASYILRQPIIKPNQWFKIYRKPTK